MIAIAEIYVGMLLAGYSLALYLRARNAWYAPFNLAFCFLDVGIAAIGCINFARALP